jgi:superfamily II DNA/RNA helicase
LQKNYPPDKFTIPLTFSEFNFDPRLTEGIDALGFQIPTPIQEQAIPLIIQGRDLIGSAQTGTGKTAAFLLPIIDMLMKQGHAPGIRALVIVPTRELAMQIDQHMEGLAYFTSVSSLPVYGGTDGATFSREKAALVSGVEMVICTPGRMLAHLNMGYVDFSTIRFLILDEADRMLDMGFNDDIMRILAHVPAQRQTLMFCATMPPDIRSLAKKILKDPAEINIAIATPADNILQMAYTVYDTQKLPMVKYLLGNAPDGTVLIFCSTKSSTKLLSRELKRAGVNVLEIHSDLEQSEREQVMRSFRNREIQALVATDVVSRGIDVDNIDLVLNYDVPNDAEDYIHRIGRTARAAASGVAITFINPKGQGKFRNIEQLLGKPVHKGIVPYQFGEAPEYNPKKRKPDLKRRMK